MIFYKRLYDLTYFNDFHCIGDTIVPVSIPFGDDRHITGIYKSPLLQYIDRFPFDIIALMKGDIEKQRVDIAIQSHFSQRCLMAAQAEDGNRCADARHPQRCRTGLGQGRDRRLVPRL